MKLYQLASPATFYPLAGRLAPWFAWAAGILAVAGLWIGFAIAPTDFRLAYAATGAHQCVIAGRRPFVLEPGHAVLVERWADVDSAPLAIAPLAAGGIALVVSVECR